MLVDLFADDYDVGTARWPNRAIPSMVFTQVSGSTAQTVPSKQVLGGVAAVRFNSTLAQQRLETPLSTSIPLTTIYGSNDWSVEM